MTPVPESRVILLLCHWTSSEAEIETLDISLNNEILLYFIVVFWFLFVLRGIPTHRSWVKKIRFAPGKGNQKLIAMYNDGAEVWDSKEVSPAPCGFTANEAAGHRNYVFFFLPSDL